MIHSVLAVFTTKEPQPTGITRQVGVSTYLALTFGTLLSSQGTDASFVPLPGPSGRFPSCFCVSDSIRCFRIRFPPAGGGFSFLLFRALSCDSDSTRTLSALIPGRRGCLPGPSAVPTSETLAESPSPTLIGVASLRTRIPHFANTHTKQCDR